LTELRTHIKCDFVLYNRTGAVSKVGLGIAPSFLLELVPPNPPVTSQIELCAALLSRLLGFDVLTPFYIDEWAGQLELGMVIPKFVSISKLSKGKQ